jgi:amino acid transporter
MQERSQEFFARKASGLVREISASDALMYNILQMGTAWTFIFIVYGPVVYPGVNMATTVLIAAPFVFIVALAMLFFAVSMPRSGGDFIWVSRSLHPSIGFMENFLFVVIMMSFFGPVGGWALDPGLTSLLINYGTLTSNSGLISMAHSLVTPINTFIATAIVVLTAILMTATGTKNVWRFQWACLILVIIGVVLQIGTMFAVGHATFVARFNQLSGANYSDVINAAHSAGYITGFTIPGTLIGSMYAFENFYGFAFSAYVGGEIKNVGRSQIIAILGSVIVFALITFLSYEAAYVFAGSDFIHAASYLALTGNSAWTASMPPWLNYLIVFATDNPIIAILVPLALIAGVFGAVTTVIVMATRCFFAWSFDRIIPSAFSSVEQRFHTPRNALLLAFVVSMVYLYLSAFTSLLTFLSYSTLGTFVSCTFIGIAAAVFPYRRKDILQKAPKLVQYKIGGIPIMAIFGVITAFTGIFVSATVVLPQFTGAPVNPYYLAAIIVTMIVGLVIYGIAYWHNKQRGIDMTIGFTEIPPA